MQKAVRSRYFVERIFCPGEIAYADGKGNERARAASYASAFAAREAFAKAVGISVFRLALSSRICLDHAQEGAPRLFVSPDLDTDFIQGRKRAWVSLSHDGDYAIAVVAVEKI
jgi:holo-[acyl-carrier protein] synthase